MAELFASGYFIDLILILVAVEVIALALFWRSTHRGIAPTDLLPNVCAGAFLLLALRLALSGAGWMACCASLAAAGFCHMIDLYRRWR